MNTLNQIKQEIKFKKTQRDNGFGKELTRLRPRQPFKNREFMKSRVIQVINLG